LTSSFGTVTVIENVTNYNADKFSKSRLIYLRVQDTKDNIYVTEKSNTVYILPESNNNIVHINPQSRIVYVSPQDSKKSVYVAA